MLKNILMKTKTFWKIFCGLTKQKLNFLEGACPVTSGVKVTVFQKKNIIPIIKYGGGSVMVWDCSAAKTVAFYGERGPKCRSKSSGFFI